MDGTPTRQSLDRQGYYLVGSGAVKPCLWLNRSLRGGDQCYKHHFYGISSHCCVQMTPTLECNHLCLHCWRPIDDPVQLGEPLEPKELLEGVLRGQQRFLSGYGGAKTTNPERLAESRKPRHIAISLMGEPTLYPYLEELIDLISSRGLTSFLVSNGTSPEVLSDLKPTQLYISLNASDEDNYLKMCNPKKNNWKEIMQSLRLLKELHCRSVIRMTMVRGHNMDRPEDYARIIEDAQPDFVEIKSYMHLGRSRLRLAREAMPEHHEIVRFAQRLGDCINYQMEAEVPLSRVALLGSGRISRSLAP